MADPNRRFSPAMYWVGHIATLASIFAIFAALIVAYLFRAMNPAYFRPAPLPWQLWISTGLLAACSLAIEFSRLALRRGDLRAYTWWLVRTGWLAIGFLVAQTLCWRLLARGFEGADDQNRGLFFVLTGAHALHILGGMIALGYLIWRVWNPWTTDATPRRDAITFMLATYWHFMGVIWLILFGVFAMYSA